jgi:hypothetical protein
VTLPGELASRALGARAAAFLESTVAAVGSGSTISLLGGTSCCVRTIVSHVTLALASNGLIASSRAQLASSSTSCWRITSGRAHGAVRLSRRALEVTSRTFGAFQSLLSTTSKTTSGASFASGCSHLVGDGTVRTELAAIRLAFSGVFAGNTVRTIQCAFSRLGSTRGTSAARDGSIVGSISTIGADGAPSLSYLVVIVALVTVHASLLTFS